MEIGIVTMGGENYGTVLQNYALQSVLKVRGASAHTIQRRSKSVALQFLRKYFIPNKNANTIQKLKLLYADTRYRVKNRKIKEFRAKRIDCITYKTEEMVRNGEAKTDLFICGSDQIWNPQFVRYPLYMLNFVKKGARCYSYAASLAVDSIEEDDKDFYKENLRKFQMISVREKTGAQLLSSLVGADKVRCDVDPVLLLDSTEWKTLAGKRFENKKYIFVYMLRPMKSLLCEAARLGKTLNLDVIYIGNYCYSIDGITTVYDAGVEDFLSAILNASLVLTNSFHATAFSAIFEKQFLSVVISRTGSRVSDFLEDMQLQDRIVRDEIACDVAMKPIDFSATKRIVASKRRDSLRYIDRIIESGGHTSVFEDK